MVECWLPYGKTEIHITVPIQDLMGILEPRFNQPLEDAPTSLEKAIAEAFKGEAAEKASGGLAAIAIDGALNPSLAALASSKVVERLRGGGASPDSIVLIVGNGWRRHSDPQLIEALRAQGPLRDLKIYEHTLRAGELTDLGATERGTMVSINRHFASAQLRIVIGETHPDALTGFKGPQDVLLPGISSLKTVEMNRIHALREVPGPGKVEGNQLLEDVMEVAKLADVDLAVNIVSSPEGGLLGVYAGDLEEVWRRAISDFGEAFRVRVENRPEILVLSAGGFKHDHDLYSAIWALSPAKDMADRGFLIILAAECSEGLGVEGLRTLSKMERVEELRRSYTLGAEAVNLLKSTLRRSQVHIVSALPRSYLEPLGLKPHRTANEALASAVEGRRGRKTLVIPRGCITIPELS
ncbi:DUF2088 domain-containing protein [Candidatus Bathyarchaeota archaeon]|nr:DUF2088 domain-containing protein [Candidatus Bathyarchaeota archaeon]